jgi:hypothetical protein
MTRGERQRRESRYPRRKMTRVLPVLAFGMLLLAHGLAWGNEAHGSADRLRLDPPGRFTIGLGVYLTSFDSSIRLDTKTLKGTRIDLEKDLGLDASQSLFRADAEYRLARRQYVVFSYYDISRTGERNLLNRQIRFGDEVFNVNSNIEGFLDTQFFSLAYRYSFARTRRAELGLSVGASVVTLGTGIALAASATTPGEEHHVEVATDAKFVAPVPLAGLYGRWQIARKVTVSGSFQYIELTFQGITGSDTDADVRVEYYPIRRLGLGLGYAFNRIKLDPIRRSNFRGRFLYDFGGLELYAKYAL